MSTQTANPTFLIANLSLDDPIFDRCNYAQTLTGFSKRHDRWVVILLPCNQWSCRQCANLKVKRIAYRVNVAKPNRLLTLTIDPDKYQSPREAFDDTSSKVSVLIRQLRPRFGDIEYLRVTELTNRGWPHYHLLVRSGYLPHPVVRDRWESLTGATIVDLRQVHNRFRTYVYLVKYLSKMHNLEWTKRHMSYSRKFFRDKDENTGQADELYERQVNNIHPYHFLEGRNFDQTIEVLAPGVFALTGESPSPSLDPDPTAWQGF